MFMKATLWLRLRGSRGAMRRWRLSAFPHVFTAHFTFPASRPTASLLLHYSCLHALFTSLTLTPPPFAIRRVGRVLDPLDSIRFSTHFREAGVHQAAGEPGGVGRRHGGILLRGARRPDSNCPLEERGGGAAAGQVPLKTTQQQQGADRASLLLSLVFVLMCCESHCLQERFPHFAFDLEKKPFRKVCWC